MSVSTYITNFNIIPTSGKMPFTVQISGYLSRYTVPETTSTGGPTVNEEPIEIQILSPTGWAGTGVTAVTNSSGESYGYFSTSMTFEEKFLPSGVWQFRAHYVGSVAKGLAASDSPPVAINASGTFPWTMILAGVAGLGLLGLLVVRRRKKRR